MPHGMMIYEDVTYIIIFCRATLNDIFYLISMKMTSATFVCAMANLLPAFTFMLAVMFRMERLRIKTRIGQAKVMGTLIGIGGAMLLTFYKGAKFQLWPVHSQLLHHQADQQHKSGNQQALGTIFAVDYALTYAIWLIIQAKMNDRYPHPYSSTALMCLFTAVQSTCIAGVVDRTISAWKLSWDVKLLTTIYGAVFVSAMVLSLMSWAVKKRGPVFVSVFSPLSLVITAILVSIFLDETLHLGSVIAAGFIILGLYIVLWGKGKEMEQLIAQLPTQLSSGDPAKASFGGMLLESLGSHVEGETKYKGKKENTVGVQVG
ncbi:WAT1-related protein At1g09380-like isoform X1 [Nymphaea colorata]|nr:WAT1-related protein At1g09380-like isoform X1 [Nymphaea colorata]